MMQDVRINGVRLKVQRIVVDESLPTIIFLHDSLGCIELWRDFPELVGKATGLNVLVYDRQGYGKSQEFDEGYERDKAYMGDEADVLHALIEQLGLKEVILFGHSDGGSIALIAAARYPEKIKAIITEGAHIFVEEVTLDGIRTAVDTYENTNFEERLAKYHGDKTEDMFCAWANTWLMDSFRNWNIEKFLPKITCPVLVIQGEEDEYGSDAQVHGIVKQVSGEAEELLVPNVGHTPHREAEEVVMSAVVEFVERMKG